MEIEYRNDRLKKLPNEYTEYKNLDEDLKLLITIGELAYEIINDLYQNHFKEILDNNSIIFLQKIELK